MDLPAIPASARLYLRPIAPVDSPVGYDGQVARLAGGLGSFAAYELIAVDAGRRVAQQLVPVERLPALLTQLPDRQAERLRSIEWRGFYHRTVI